MSKVTRKKSSAPFFQQLSNILKDPEASSNDRYTAMEMLKNACVSAGMVLPGCQDTGTAICIGITQFDDGLILSLSMNLFEILICVLC